MSTILITIFCILYLILAIRRIDWAVLVLIAALPAYIIRFKVLWVPFTLLEAMIFISFFVWLVKNWRQLISNIRKTFQPKKIDEKKINYPFKNEIILMLFISFIALAIVGFSNSAMGIWKAYFFEPVLVFILVINLFFKENKIDKVFLALAVSALAVSALAIYQKFTGIFIPNELWRAPETRRVTSFFGYPNAVGLYLAPIIILLVGWLVALVDKYKTEIMKNSITVLKILVLVVIIIASGLSIYFAQSDGALIALAVSLIIFGIVANRKLRIITLSIFVVLSVAMYYFHIINVNICLIDKITLNDFSGQVRKVQWKETWEMLKDGRLLFGSGLANYQTEIEAYHQSGFYLHSDDPEYEKMIKISLEYQQLYWQPLEIYLYPHNIILNFWTELGILGMLLFLWIIGKFLVQGVKFWVLDVSEGSSQKDYFALGLVCAMIVIVVHGVVDVPYFKNDLSVLFWVMIALLGLIDLGRGGRAVEGATLEKS